MKRIVHGIEITKGDDGLWRDFVGNIYAFEDEGTMTDPVTRCGVGLLSLPEDSNFTPGCKAHDNLYSNLTFQASNPRSRADRILLDQLLIVAGRNPFKRAAAYAMYHAARIIGARSWEDPTTRGK